MTYHGLPMIPSPAREHGRAGKYQGDPPVRTPSNESRVLAVVGSTSFARGGEAIRVAGAIIDGVISALIPDLVVSGGAAGVDTWAREVAGGLGYTLENGRFVEHLPRHRRWAPDGFQARNILVATGPTTHLLSIRCHASRTYGSGWTADYAERHGRIVYRVIL